MSDTTSPLTPDPLAVPARPPQVPSELSRPFWDAALEGRLVIQQCAACGKLRHYPRLLCDNCYSDAVQWKTASGDGMIHSWTVAHHAFHPSMKQELPYTLVTVDLAEGVRALGRWSGDASKALKIGTPVRGGFVPREGGVDLVFTPV
jgi:uncharacterized OB-fold protein